MTIANLHKIFKVQMDKNAEAVAFGGCPAFLPQEIDVILNQAYVEVICNKFTGNNFLRIGFEGAVKRTADLQKLVKTDKNVTLAYTNSASNVLTMSNFFKDGGSINRMFYVDCVLHFGNNSSSCILVDHESARRFLMTYNNKPWIDTPVATLEDNTLKIFIDPMSMTASSYSADITYVKYPELISSNNYNTDINEVPEYVLYEVIDRAVVIALENIESQRTATKSQIDTTNE